METESSVQNYASGLLKRELELRKQKNPRYSLRSFAKNLGMSPAQLSQLISGKRKFSPESLRQVSEQLHLSPEQVATLFSRTLMPQPAGSPEEQKRKKLAEDEFRTIADWYHLAILCLGKIRGANADAFWMADRLGITPAQAREALARLVRLQIIEEGKIFKRKTPSLNISSEIPSAAIQSYHHSLLNMAQEKLRDTPPERRDFSAMTVATDPAKLPEIRKMIEEFQDRLAAFAEPGNPQEVFVFSCQFFSLERNK
ncbi:hypothetical protein AZI86_18140 [Bdellovibrio bacteriovorus]|uniref:HTH cro/C1-type domain-containing protein n=1 Tax=Bdellovibrio bacteriovorus TaxID=959 RepID=A0A150WF82_BDEBC|nr:TIGR02147 family protein [Bdellovibrio bacteriovorus]KYG61624.1 hypothetical protein AZI86_18140 [Bdellovibrio bacteriovorus]